MKIYEIIRTDNEDIIVRSTALTEAVLKEKAQRITKQPPSVFGRSIGLFYWNYDSSISELGGYAPQAVYPDMYKDGEHLYIAFDDIEDLSAEYPMNRFIWAGEADPLREEELHYIRIE
ncbi:MAG: hypothetical protein K6B44_07440 [Lachnospiraceae bacterium]|nr:hypothetical protein [Lachnospiraceae bacterium]